MLVILPAYKQLGWLSRTPNQNKSCKYMPILECKSDESGITPHINVDLEICVQKRDYQINDQDQNHIYKF